MDAWLRSPDPLRFARQLLQDREQYLQRVEAAAFPNGAMARLEHSPLPAELRQRVYKELVLAHFLRTPREAPYAPVTTTAKFTAKQHAVAVMRGVLSPSPSCPDFLPDLAKDSEEARQIIGRAFVEEAEFVFSGPHGFYAYGMAGEEEIPWFRRFVSTLGTSKRSGYRSVRSLTFPAFAYDGGEEAVVELVLDCAGLQHLTLGFGQSAMCKIGGPPRLRDLDEYLERSRLSELHHASLRTVTLVMGPSRRHEWRRLPPSVVDECGAWLVTLAKTLKRRFVEAHKASTVVYVDSDTQWDHVGLARKEEVQCAE